MKNLVKYQDDEMEYCDCGCGSGYFKAPTNKKEGKMIVNAHNTMYVIVELEKKDVEKILKGESVCMEARAPDDEPTLVRIYCSDAYQSNEVNDRCWYDSSYN